MSKGTVRGTPGATHAFIVVVLNDDTNYPQVPKGFVLKTGPKYPYDPNDVFHSIEDGDGDYVEFTITSYNLGQDGKTWEGSCQLTKKITGKGIGAVIDGNVVDKNAVGILKVILANRDTGMDQGQNRGFTNKTGALLKKDDLVEFENTTTQSCDAVRKIESTGGLTSITDPRLINVKRADAHHSGLIGQDLNYPLPFISPTVYNVGDTVEIDFPDNSSCQYVQLIGPSTT